MRQRISITSLPLFLILLISISYSVSAKGNRILNNPDNKSYWGARLSLNKALPASVNICDIKYDTYQYFDFFDPGYGVSIGGIFHLPIVANFYFEPGLSFNFSRFHINTNAFIGDNKELLENGGILKKNSVIYTSVKLPLVLGYHFDLFKDFNVSLFMGPVINSTFSMKAKIKIETGSGVKETETSLFKPYQSNDDDYLRRFYAQWRIGASFNYRQFMIGINFDGDISNMLKVSDYNKQFYRGHFSLSELLFNIGYNFK